MTNNVPQPVDFRFLKKKWGCTDVPCNVQPAKKGAKCPDRVYGSADYIYNSFRNACNAAKDHAASQVPKGCQKKHCYCENKCTKG